MVNKTLFSTESTALKADTINKAGGKAYKLDDRSALTQMAMTCCFGNTFYADPKTQLDEVSELISRVASTKDGQKFLAKLAVYSRTHGFMKDMPALLLSHLAVKAPGLYEQVFSRVCDNFKMIRNHVQIIRSGAVDGRRSMPAAMRRQLKAWFASRSNDRLFKDNVGKSPSLKDVIKMVHPKPRDKTQEALFGYLTDSTYDKRRLPKLAKEYEAFKKSPSTREVPDVPFQMVDSLITDAQWVEVATNAKWNMTKKNLNTFQRHGVFNSDGMSTMIANRLKDEKEIARAMIFPYELMSAWMHINGSVPYEITDALQEAMEISTRNIPKIEGEVYIFVDISHSMHALVSGNQHSKMTCKNVAAMIASSILRVNPQAHVIPFESRPHFDFKLNSRDSIATNTQKINNAGNGGTNIGACVDHLAKTNKKVDAVIYLSDNESWIGTNYGYYGHTQNWTLVKSSWEQIKRHNRKAKMICANLSVGQTTQAPDDKSIMNLAGFSDRMFTVMDQFLNNKDGKHWVDVVEEEVSLD